MTAQKTCFLVMPIGREGTDDHAYFRALYEEVYRQTVAPLGYEVVRADEMQKAGAITKDIVLGLAEADLVVVDLTDLNPNVFYELGVRHSLRGQGTIMTVNESRTPNIPFDVGAYRVIKFRGDLPGYGKLRRELISFVKELESGEADRRDNPVHDWIPALPGNALEASLGSAEGDLRQKLARAQQKIQEYEETYGIARASSGTAELSPLAVVMTSYNDATDGNLPSDLLKRTQVAARQRDKKDFLGALRTLFERDAGRLSPEEYRGLASLSENLGLGEVTGAIFTQARKVHPKDKELRKREFAYFAHSHDPATRERARQELLSDIGITLKEDRVEISSQFDQEPAHSFGIMLDAFHDDDLHQTALKITQAAVERQPDMTIVVRNHARALEQAKRGEEALVWYQRALLCPDADDTSAVWFGTALHNRRRHVDAVEVYLRACLMDPDDANGFSHVADELTWALHERLRKGTLGQTARQLPESITISTIEQSLIAALSCRLIGEDES